MNFVSLKILVEKTLVSCSQIINYLQPFPACNQYVIRYLFPNFNQIQRQKTQKSQPRTKLMITMTFIDISEAQGDLNEVKKPFSK